MIAFPTTIVWRHRKERLKKCSLTGLEGYDDLAFFRYPGPSLPAPRDYLILKVDAPMLKAEEKQRGLLLLDATWRYASHMLRALPEGCYRSLPPEWRTAYPRRQRDCPDQARGLASVEALFAAYTLLGRSSDHLLTHYHWKERFLSLNAELIEEARENASLRLYGSASFAYPVWPSC